MAAKWKDFFFFKKTMQLMSLILVSLLLTVVKEEKWPGQRLEEFTETFNAFQMQNWLKFSYGRRWNAMVITTDLFKNILWKSRAFISDEGRMSECKQWQSRRNCKLNVI